MNIFSISKRHYYRLLHYFFQLRKHQWLSPADLKQIQKKRLKLLINHAYHNVPFYHDLFHSVGIKPKHINDIKDLQHIPIIGKEEIKKNFPDKIISKQIDKANCFTRTTTGSTGIPLKVIFNSDAYDYYSSLNFFTFMECGIRVTDKIMTIRHEGYFNDNESLVRNILQKFSILNWQNVSIFNPIESIVAALKDFAPDAISTYPSILSLLSQEIAKEHTAAISPRLIITGGETLTDQNRNRISQIFNSDIYRLYSTEEFGRLAFECKKNSGYHMITDAAVIEFVKDNNNAVEGEESEIVVTSLFNYAMPLIRYRLGDIGVFTNENCACGRGFPLIKKIEGRRDDFLILPSGRKISPRVINVIEDIPGISMYKTVQKSNHQIIVSLVPGIAFSEQTIKDIKNHIISGCFGEEVNVDVELVEELPRNARGKLRAVVSHVKQ